MKSKITNLILGIILGAILLIIFLVIRTYILNVNSQISTLEKVVEAHDLYLGGSIKSGHLLTEKEYKTIIQDQDKAQ